MSEVILHLGMGKSASTTIQKNILQDPEAPLVISRHYRERDESSGLQPMWWRGLCCNKLDRVEQAKSIFQRFFLNRSEKIVLSDEVIAGSPDLALNLVNNLKDICTVRVLLVIRRQDHFLTSLYNHGGRSRVVAFGLPRINTEVIDRFSYKGSYDQWIEDLLESQRLGDENILKCIDYYSRFIEFTRVLGQDNVLFLPFELLKVDKKTFTDKLAMLFDMDERLCFGLMTNKEIKNKTGERLVDYHGGSVAKRLMAVKSFRVLRRFGLKKSTAEKVFTLTLSAISQKRLVSLPERERNESKVLKVFEKNNRALDEILEYDMKALGYY